MAFVRALFQLYDSGITAYFTILVGIFLLIIANLAGIAVQSGGRPWAWREPMFELPWFGEWPGYSGGGHGLPYPAMQMPGAGVVVPAPAVAGGPISTLPVMQDGSYVVQQQPGYSMVITPGVGGGPPNVQHVPGHV